MRFDYKNVRVLVVGDAMLDMYYYGSVDRISPEAPVPVVKANKVKRVLGGAANVCRNIASLGGVPTFLGFVGSDSESEYIRRLLIEGGIKDESVRTKRDCIKKIRVVGEHQQIARIDFDNNESDYTDAEFEELRAKVAKLLLTCEVVVISDYDKGVCRADVCRAVIGDGVGPRVLVDPKGRYWEKYRGSFLVKPNLKELGLVVQQTLPNHDAEILHYAEEVRNRYGIVNLLVTRSEKGMSLFSSTGAEHLPTASQEVFDVSGAGDTVLAVAALEVAIGCGLSEAMLSANAAAGVVVGKLGTATITQAELLKSLKPDSLIQKIIEMSEIPELVRGLRASPKRIVFTNGCFDLLHRGHVEYLAEARGRGDILIVGVNSDISTRKLKGPTRPINKESDRAMVLAALECVDFVVVFGEETPLELVRMIKPDLLVKGGDYDPERIVGRDYAGETIALKFVDNYSTTRILERSSRLS